MNLEKTKREPIPLGDHIAKPIYFATSQKDAAHNHWHFVILPKSSLRDDSWDDNHQD